MEKIKIEDRRKQNIEVKGICLSEIRNLLIECLDGQEEIKKLISSGVVSTYYCKSYDFKRQGRRCTKQCISCEWMEKKQ